MLTMKNNLDEKIYNNINLYKLILLSKNKMLFLFGLYDYVVSLLHPNYLCNLLIDYDQCSSGPMIYSLLSQDKEMGHLTNALPKKSEEHQDLYIHFLQEFFKELSVSSNKYLKELNKNKEEIFKRDFSKLIIMPTFYNMGSKGLKDLLISYLSSNELIDKKDLKDLLKLLIPLIQKLLNMNYKHTMSFQNKLVEVSKILFNNKE